MTPPATKKRKEGQQEISLRQMLENSTLPPPRERSARYLASNDTTTLKKQNNSLIFSIPHLRMFDRNRQHPSEDIVLPPQILQQHDVPRDQIIGMRFAPVWDWPEMFVIISEEGGKSLLNGKSLSEHSGVIEIREEPWLLLNWNSFSTFVQTVSENSVHNSDEERPESDKGEK